MVAPISEPGLTQQGGVSVGPTIFSELLGQSPTPYAYP